MHAEADALHSDTWPRQLEFAGPCPSAAKGAEHEHAELARLAKQSHRS